MIRTLNVNTPYQHEINDALVKMTLNYIQFAKDNGLMKEMLAHELATEMPMLTANRQAYRRERRRRYRADGGERSHRVLLPAGAGG